MGNFSIKTRNQIINQLPGQTYDLLIVGGGITGAGILLDAQSRGLKAIMVEMQDFAAGTSSRSTKLIHGGLRYLKQFEFKLVADVGRERAIVYELGPHVTKSEPMLLPIIKGGSISRFVAWFGIWLYDMLARVKKHEQRRMLTKEETLKIEPLLSEKNLNGGAYYYEYRTDDARLTIEIIKEAIDRGAAALNYTKVTAFNYDNGKITGAKVRDLLGGNEINIQAKKVVNAAGPWVDEVMKLDDVKKAGNLFLTKGVHVVVDHEKLPLKQSVYFDVKDGRMVFAIPRDGKTYIGTTDTEYHENIENPEITKEDKTYLIAAVNRIFPSLNICVNDIESGWAGLRPLIRQAGKSPSEISRKDEIFVNDSGLISIAGGKLTGYRLMAKKIVDMMTKVKCTTNKITLSGGKVEGSKNFQKFIDSTYKEGVKAGLSEQEATALAESYGSNVHVLYDIVKSRGEEAEKYNLSKVLFAKLIYAIEHEMVVTPADFFIRRTGMLYFDIADVIKYKNGVIDYMRKEFSWSLELENNYGKELEMYIKLAKGN